MKKTLLIGGTGFVGQYLKKVVSQPVVMNEEGQSIDIRDVASLEKYISDISPDYVVHLAAQSAVPESFKNPLETIEINFLGTFNLLMALRKSGFKGRMLYISSGQVYGMVSEKDLPLHEERPLKPINPYAVSKVASEVLCYQWSQSGEFEIVIARPFNHIGIGQSERFAIPSFARQIVEIKRGIREPILKVGDLSTKRDFADVRDVVKAYKLLLEKGKNGESYNVSSAQAISMDFILSEMLKIANISPKIEQDPERLRVTDQAYISGSFEKILKDTGWKPEIDIQTTLKDIINHIQQKGNL